MISVHLNIVGVTTIDILQLLTHCWGHEIIVFCKRYQCRRITLLGKLCRYQFVQIKPVLILDGFPYDS